MQKYKIEHHQSNDCTCSWEEVVADDNGSHYLVTEVDAALAEKETANEILRNMNKRFFEEHEILRQQFMKKDLSITNLKEEVLRVDGQIAALKTENLNLYEASRKTIERQAEEILAQEKELEITTGSWATAANIVEAQIKQIAALKDELAGYVILKEDYTQASALLVATRRQIAELKLHDVYGKLWDENQSQAEEIVKLREAVQRVIEAGYPFEWLQAALKSEPEVSPKHTNLPAGLVEEMWMSGERCMRQNEADALKSEPEKHVYSTVMETYLIYGPEKGEKP